MTTKTSVSFRLALSLAIPLSGILAPVSAPAAPTSLAFIPIADVLRHRELLLERSAFKRDVRADPKIHYYESLNIGLFDRIEVGVDSEPGGGNWYHTKLLLIENPDKSDFALSVGIQNADFKGYSEPYAVARIGLGRARLHLGTMRVESWRLMAGIDAEAGDWSLAADFMSGAGGVVWLGGGYNFPNLPGLFVGAYLGVPLKRSDGFQGQLYFGYWSRM